MPYPAYVPTCGLPPRTGKRSAAGRSGSIPAIVPDGGIHALSGLRSFLRAHPPRTGKRSAAGRSGAVPAIVPDGGINALSCLRSFLRAPPPRTGKRSAAGQDTSSSIPAVVPDGGIHALSGLRSFLRAPPQDRQAQRRRAAGSGQLPQFTVRRRARSCG